MMLPDTHTALWLRAGDPADRIIVATALQGHTLVTGDRTILAWDGNLARLDARE